MNISTRIGMAGAAILVSIAAYASATCPVDGSNSYATGNSKVDSLTGRLLYEHRCARGHTFWSNSS